MNSLFERVILRRTFRGDKKIVRKVRLPVWPKHVKVVVWHKHASQCLHQWGALFFSENPLLGEGFPEKNNFALEGKTIFGEANNKLLYLKTWQKLSKQWGQVHKAY